jgi:glycosyltransferase involved in cell wall biosynthesis
MWLNSARRESRRRNSFYVAFGGAWIMAFSLSVIVPAYNEQRTIRTVLSSLIKAVPDVHEIIVVDDGSTDGTAQAAQELARLDSRISVLQLDKNQGKTAALVRGLAASTGDIVLVQDADLEYDPKDIPSLVEPIISGKADVVYGSRFLVRREARVLYFRHYLANQFLTFISNVLTDLNFTDIETGYKAFRGEIIRNMVIESRRFGFEIEVTAKIAKLHCKVYEVPISYYGRTYEEGKKIGFADGLAAFFYILKYNLFCSLRAAFVQLPEIHPSREHIRFSTNIGSDHDLSKLS